MCLVNSDAKHTNYDVVKSCVQRLKSNGNIAHFSSYYKSDAIIVVLVDIKQVLERQTCMKREREKLQALNMHSRSASFFIRKLHQVEKINE